MLADNSSHLRTAARSKHEATRKRALAALARLEADGTRVTVTAPAHPAKASPARTTDESWQRRLDLAHQRIKDLAEENKQLRTQLALAHGQRRTERSPR
jgi:hypothetical protein